jgi:hypothetical protein
VSKPRADRLKICDESLPPPPPDVDFGGDTSTLRAQLEQVVHELTAARHALWQREAELAAGVPVASQADEKQCLAERLQAVLKGGAEALDCQAAALYLLDEGTRHLKLRSSWGLPPKRLTEPPRPLAGAVGDLEALLGHAVVLTDAALAQSWNAPETSPAALCVPVASPTIPLGTLWFFAHEARDFSDRQTNLAEIIAGRIAADLDREALLNDATTSEPAKRLFRELDSWRQDNAERVMPIVPGWKLSLSPSMAGADAMTINEVLAVGPSRIAALAATLRTTPLTAALAATALRVAFAAHASQAVRADRLLERLNHSLCFAFPGNVEASATILLTHTRTGRYRFARAGEAVEPALLLTTDRDGRIRKSRRLLASPSLGRSIEATYSQAAGCIDVGYTATLGGAIRLQRTSTIA